MVIFLLTALTAALAEYEGLVVTETDTDRGELLVTWPEISGLCGTARVTLIVTDVFATWHVTGSRWGNGHASETALNIPDAVVAVTEYLTAVCEASCDELQEQYAREY